MQKLLNLLFLIEVDRRILRGSKIYTTKKHNDDLMGDEGDIGLFVVDEAILHDLLYIAERSQLPFDWKELRKELKKYNSKPAHLILT